MNHSNLYIKEFSTKAVLVLVKNYIMLTDQNDPVLLIFLDLSDRVEHNVFYSRSKVMFDLSSKLYLNGFNPIWKNGSTHCLSWYFV